MMFTRTVAIRSICPFSVLRSPKLTKNDSFSSGMLSLISGIWRTLPSCERRVSHDLLLHSNKVLVGGCRVFACPPCQLRCGVCVVLYGNACRSVVLGYRDKRIDDQPCQLANSAVSDSVRVKTSSTFSSVISTTICRSRSRLSVVRQ